MSEDIRRSMERIDELLKMQWLDNPKIHQDSLITHSIQKYGFDDPVTIAHFPDGKMLVAGHGRSLNLETMRSKGESLPRHCELAPDGMWLIPADNITFPDKETAILYALMHNRSGTAKLMPEDYDPARLRAALGAQTSLPGFTDDDLMQTGVSAQQFDLPKYAPFDASKLPDVPPPVSSVPETFVLFVTFPSYSDLKHALNILTFGDRNTLTATAKMASLKGDEYIERWAGLILKNKPDPMPTPIEKAIQEASIQEPLAEPLVKAMEELGAVATTVEPEKITAQSHAPSIETNGKPKGRGWVGGLCSNCGGSGNLGMGTKKTLCPQCRGLCTEDAFNAHLKALAG